LEQVQGEHEDLLGLAVRSGELAALAVEEDRIDTVLPERYSPRAVGSNLAKNRLTPACSRVGRFEVQSNGEILYFRRICQAPCTIFLFHALE
jgi:hypothetical protein